MGGRKLAGTSKAAPHRNNNTLHRQTSMDAFFKRKPAKVEGRNDNDDSDDDHIPLSSLAHISAPSHRPPSTKAKTAKKRRLETGKENGLGNGKQKQPATTIVKTNTNLQSDKTDEISKTTAEEPEVSILGLERTSAADSEELSTASTKITSPGTTCEEIVMSSDSSTSNSLPYHQADVPSLHRIIGNSDMDFVQDYETNRNSKSILNQLQSRSVLGCCPWKEHAKFPPRNVATKWKTPKRIQLSSPPINNSRVDTLSFSPDGVLLAVAYGNKRIAIYNWDTIQAVDGQSRKGSKNNFAVPPFLVFEVPYSVSRLVWNPEQPDQLAVGFKVVGRTFLFELDQVEDWQLDLQRQRHRNSSWSQNPTDQRYPPPKTYTELKAASNSNQCQGTVSAILFFKEWVLVSAGTQVLGFRRSDALLLWRYQSRRQDDCVTCLSPLNHESHVLVVTQSGRMSILNASRRERAALSFQHQPVVVEEWQCSLRKGEIIINMQLSAAIHGYRQWMHVTSNGSVSRGNLVLSVDIGLKQRKSNVIHPHSKTRPRVGMFTANHKKKCDSSVLSPSTHVVVGGNEVLMSPPRVLVFNDDGGFSYLHDIYSSPSEPMISHFVDPGVVLLAKVPQTQMHLRHHDKYVVDSQPQFSRDSKDSALQLFSRGGVHTEIPVKELPRSIELHPHGEWVVLGTKDGLVLKANRR